MPTAQDVSNALSRIRGVMSPKKEAERATRDIRLGLERIVRVMPEIQEWQGVHVGGTNGKGSICAYLSGLFTLAGVSYGRFVSPAFPEKHNAVTINGSYVNPRVYHTESRQIESAYQRITRGWRFASSETPGPLSPFELETATAFRVFNKMHVQYGIVEVGMGGATDATNAMKRKAVTVISKIDLDHQEYLGNTIEEIAKVKAGIMRPGVPCIVDHTNQSSVIDVLRKHARAIGTQISLSWKAEPFLSTLDNDWWQLEDYQKQNLMCAALAFRHLFPLKEINLNKLLEMEPYLPGRMEWVHISDLTQGQYKSPVLVDAAHNMLGVESLARYTNRHLRPDDKPITWVIGFSSSKAKPFARMLETLVRPHDNVAFAEFERRDHEPPSTPAQIGREVVQSIVNSTEQIYDGDPDIQSAIDWASKKAEVGQIVVTGSLYLIRDFYKLDGISRSRDMQTRSPGPSQLWRYSKMWRRRPLSTMEYSEFSKARSKWDGLQNRGSLIEGGDVEPQASNPQADITKTTSPQEAAPDLEKLDVTDEAFRGDETPPQATFADVTDLKQRVERHERQLQGYQAAVRTIEEDIAYEMRRATSSPESIAQMQTEADVLKAQLAKHQAAYDKAVDELRSHPDAPRQYALTHEQIFGKPSIRRSTPFMERTELDPEPAKEGSKTVEETDSAEQAPGAGEEEEVPMDFWGRPEGIDQIPEEIQPKKRKQQ